MQGFCVFGTSSIRFQRKRTCFTVLLSTLKHRFPTDHHFVMSLINKHKKRQPRFGVKLSGHFSASLRLTHMYTIRHKKVIKRFHRNQKHVGMAVANKVWKQVWTYYHSTMHRPTLPSLHKQLQVWLAEVATYVEMVLQDGAWYCDNYVHTCLLLPSLQVFDFVKSFYYFITSYTLQYM